MKIGTATVQLLMEESAMEPNFTTPRCSSPTGGPRVAERRIASWLMPDHYDEATNSLKLSVHSWLLSVGGKRILIDTCIRHRQVA